MVTVNPNAKEIQYTDTGKPAHHGSYLIHIGEPGAPNPGIEDLIDETKLRVEGATVRVQFPCVHGRGSGVNRVIGDAEVWRSLS